MATQRRGLKWWGAVIGIVVGLLTIAVLSLTLCTQMDLASPVSAATKDELAEVETKINATDDRVDALEKTLATMDGKLDAVLGLLRDKQVDKRHRR
jgi:septal ring factor EnvC (AmiA/AmiB activator)